MFPIHVYNMVGCIPPPGPNLPAQRVCASFQCHLGALARLPMESRAVARMLPYATDSRCPPASAGDLCRKAHAREPWLPVLPPFSSSTETGMNPCLRLDVGAGKMMNTCLPGAHVLAAWHSLAAEALKPLFQHPDLRLVSGLTLNFGESGLLENEPTAPAEQAHTTQRQ